MANQPLQVFDTVAESYRIVWSLIGYLPVAAAVPYGLSLLISMPVIVSPSSGGLGTIAWLLETLPYTLFAVAWHRLVLLGPTVAAPRLAVQWAPRHWRYLGYTLLIAMSGGLVMIYSLSVAGPAGGAGGGPLIALILLILLCFLTVRLFFVLPAAALDEDYRLQHSWMHTRGQALRLLATLFVTMLPIVVATMLVAGQLALPAGPGEIPAPSSGRMLMVQLVVGAIGYVGTALSTTVIALAFRQLAGWYPGDQHKA